MAYPGYTGRGVESWYYESNNKIILEGLSLKKIFKRGLSQKKNTGTWLGVLLTDRSEQEKRHDHGGNIRHELSFSTSVSCRKIHCSLCDLEAYFLIMKR